MADLPGFVWALVLLGVVGIPAVTCVMLYRGAVAAGVGTRAAAGIAGGTFVVIGGWLVVSGLIAEAGFYRQQPGQVRPWLGVAFAGILTVLLLATRIPVVSRVLAEPGTLARLVLPHTLRVAGVLFLIVMALGKLPPVFALPAGLGDIAVGLAAPLVAWRVYHGAGRRQALWFNVLGIVDLVVAVTIGFLAGLGPFRPLDVTPTTEALSLLPLTLVATGAVPVALALHIVSLRRLRASRSLPGHGDSLLRAAG
ncbi:hypothetical protein ACTWPT_44415 [Nonomuraea sp. 3N208]|uniref:hypothetical protein n=1 Tax=Nonomuraea sp. 3N208 TaxID=3457421 RepID=UPI003FD687FF